jgi:16S rRNA (adenine1518-N6/adenine1519-N6)-dimethyltransferase
MIPNPRQTLSYLRTLFQERGIHPKNKLGQNFLVDLNLLDLVVRTAELDRSDLAVEVGSGTGSLTMKLVEQAGAVVSVEVDSPFASLTNELIENHFAMFGSAHEGKGAAQQNVTLLHCDALDGKNTLQPQFVEALRTQLARPGIRQLKLVANLPYGVSVPVINNLLLTDLPIERMVVMVQLEVAERLTATPGHKEYAGLAVMVQSLADVTIVRRLPPSAFWPQPQVDSAIVMIRPQAAKREKVCAEGGSVLGLRSFLRDLYVHRRKNLRGALSSMPSGRLEKAEVDGRLEKLGVDGKVRSEALDIEQHLELWRAFRE